MKIVIVSTFSLSTNYSRDLGVAVRKVASSDDCVILCGKKDDVPADNEPPKINNVWTPGWLFFFQILFFSLKERPAVIHFQQEFRLYGNIISNILFPWLILLLRISGIKTIVTIHAVISYETVSSVFLQSFFLPQNSFTKRIAFLYLFYTYFLCGMFANSVIVLTPVLKELLIKDYRLPEGKINVIRIGIPEIKNKESKTVKTNIIKRFPLIKGKKIILVFGYFSPRKGFPLLVKAFAKVLSNNKEAKDWVLVLAGNVKKEFIPYKQTIERLIKKTGCNKNIVITNYLDTEEIDDFYRLSTIGVIPGVYSIATSGALSLGLAYLKPLLAIDLKPISEDVQGTNLGLLYNPFNPNSFAQKLKIIMNDKKIYKNLYQSMKREAPNRYWTKIGMDHYQLYRKILDKEIAAKSTKQILISKP